MTGKKRMKKIKEGVVKHSKEIVRLDDYDTCVALDGVCLDDDLNFNCAGFHQMDYDLPKYKWVSYQTKYYRYPSQLESAVDSILEVGLEEALDNGWIGTVWRNDRALRPWEPGKDRQLWVPRIGDDEKKPADSLIWHPWFERKDSVLKANEPVAKKYGKRKFRHNLRFELTFGDVAGNIRLYYGNRSTN